MTLSNLPSLGASTAVPGAAGLVTSVAGNVKVTSTSTGQSASTDPLSPASDAVSGLVNWIKANSTLTGQTDPLSPLTNAGADAAQQGGTAAASGVASVMGDPLKWVQDNWPLLIVLGIVLLLAFYGLSAATRKS